MKLINISLHISNYLLLLLFKKVKALENESIIGGYYGDIQNFPYQVTLISSNGECGGSIISDQHIISAAHCVINKKTLETFVITAHGGITDMDKEKDSEFKVEFDVKEFYFLKEYFNDNIWPAVADIVVIKVNGMFDFAKNPKTQKLNLPSTGFALKDYVGRTAHLASFGIHNLFSKPYFDDQNKLQYNGKTSRVLIYNNAKILSEKLCKLYNPDIQEGQFCAQFVKTKTDPKGFPDGTCYGDSGSSLVFHKEIIGILSVGPVNCDETFDASVYISVYHHKKFIENALNSYCDPCSMYCKIKNPDGTDMFQ